MMLIFSKKLQIFLLYSLKIIKKYAKTINEHALVYTI